MDKQRMIWGLAAYLGMFLPLIGFVIGFFRYRKNKDDVRRKVENDYHKAQEKGGVHSLFYKHTGTRIFKKTFGTPVLICFILGLILLYLAFAHL